MGNVHAEAPGGQSLPSETPSSSGVGSTQLAVCLDGTVLLCSTYLSEKDLSGRTVQMCIVLTLKEAKELWSHLSDGEQEFGAKFVGRLPKKVPPAGH